MGERAFPVVLHIDEVWPVLVVGQATPDTKLTTSLPRSLLDDYALAKKALATAEDNIIRHLVLSGATRELENLAPFILNREGQSTDGA